MTINVLKTSLVAFSLGLVSLGTVAADAPVSPAKGQVDEPIYGSQLMTQKERMEHRNKMHSLKTAEEREAYRAEHHRLMQERAKERGVTLPDAPPARGMGMGPGPGMGMGPGMGPGGPNR